MKEIKHGKNLYEHRISVFLQNLVQDLARKISCNSSQTQENKKKTWSKWNRDLWQAVATRQLTVQYTFSHSSAQSKSIADRAKKNIDISRESQENSKMIFAN
jgi:hypothetical protein